MFSLTNHLYSRRELLRIGGLSLMGLSSVELEALRAISTETSGSANGRHTSCVFLFLFGGPSQIDLWDMKPEAPAEIRGEFRPRSTCVPGIQICEHLPRMAAQMDKLCLLRSMTHNMNVHGPACSEVFTGREYYGAPTTDQATDLDWPSLSSMAQRFSAADRGPVPSVVLPWYLQFPGQAKRIAGQTGGRMGERFNSLLLQGDSDQRSFRLDGFELHETTSLQRIDQRRALLSQVQSLDESTRERSRAITDFSRYREKAYHMIRERAGQWMDLSREPQSLRDRYGKSMVGQSLLLARRLIEAGVSLITVNWEDETKIDGVNTCWDTHQDNFPKLKNLLCPIFDEAFPTFIADLASRGLLETTLVVAIGEFGRTPRIGQFSQSSNTRKTGRDHWPLAFTAILAGGGVRGGQVYGQTNAHGATVKDKPVSPADLSATILQHLGVDPNTRYVDEIQEQSYRASIGRPIHDLA